MIEILNNLYLILVKKEKDLEFKEISEQDFINKQNTIICNYNNEELTLFKIKEKELEFNLLQTNNLNSIVLREVWNDLFSLYVNWEYQKNIWRKSLDKIDNLKEFVIKSFIKDKNNIANDILNYNPIEKINFIDRDSINHKEIGLNIINKLGFLINNSNADLNFLKGKLNELFEKHSSWFTFFELLIDYKIKSVWEIQVLTYNYRDDVSLWLEILPKLSAWGFKKESFSEIKELSHKLVENPVGLLYRNLLINLETKQPINIFRKRFLNKYELNKHDEELKIEIEEIERKLLNWEEIKNAKLFEKVDWSVLTVLKEWNNIFIATKSNTFSLNDLWNTTEPVLKGFQILLKNNNLTSDNFEKNSWLDLDKYNYSFELVTKENHVCVDYTEEEFWLYPLIIRDKKSLQELPRKDYKYETNFTYFKEDETERLLKYNPKLFKRVNTFSLDKNLESIMKELASKKKGNLEGCILEFLDKNWTIQRCKLKPSIYFFKKLFEEFKNVKTLNKILVRKYPEIRDVFKLPISIFIEDYLPILEQWINKITNWNSFWTFYQDIIDKKIKQEIEGDLEIRETYEQEKELFDSEIKKIKENILLQLKEKDGTINFEKNLQTIVELARQLNVLFKKETILQNIADKKDFFVIVNWEYRGWRIRNFLEEFTKSELDNLNNNNISLFKQGKIKEKDLSKVYLKELNYYNWFSFDKSNKDYSVSFLPEFVNIYKNKIFISPSEQGRSIVIKMQGKIHFFNYDNFLLKNNGFIWIKQKQNAFVIFVQ